MSYSPHEPGFCVHRANVASHRLGASANSKAGFQNMFAERASDSPDSNLNGPELRFGCVRSTNVLPPTLHAVFRVSRAFSSGGLLTLIMKVASRPLPDE